MVLSFESRQEAKERSYTHLLKVREGKKPKNHSGNLQRLSESPGLENLKQMVEGLPSGTRMNWSALAREYHITNKAGAMAKNGGQIVKDWLISEGVDVTRFQMPVGRLGGDQQRLRRKKLRGAGGTVYYIRIIHVM